MTPQSPIRNCLRHIRSSHGLTVPMFAARLAVSDGHYVNFEAGRATLSRAVVELCAERFGLDPAWLLKGHIREVPEVGGPRERDPRAFESIRIQAMIAGFPSLLDAARAARIGKPHAAYMACWRGSRAGEAAHLRRRLQAFLAEAVRRQRTAGATSLRKERAA